MTLWIYFGNKYIFIAFLPPATKLGQGLIFTGVCDSVHRGGLPQCMLGADPPGSRHPPDQAPPHGSRPPWEQTPPRPGTPHTGADPPLGADTPWTRHPLGGLPLHAGIPPSLGADTPQPGTPPDQAPPQEQTSPLTQSRLGDTVNARAVCILLECNLVQFQIY